MSIFPLKKGSRGPEVFDLQRYFNLTQVSKIQVDGKFGTNTQDAVARSRTVILSPLDLQVTQREYMSVIVPALRKKGIKLERERMQVDRVKQNSSAPESSLPSASSVKRPKSRTGLWIGVGFGLLVTGLVLSTIDLKPKKKKVAA